MCFSPEVSFGASAVITTVGVVAIKKTESKGQLLFAMIPLLFGVQQFFEGWLWVALEHEEYRTIELLSKYGFLFFAQLIWPIWIPLSVYVIEKKRQRKHLIAFSLAAGIVLFLLLGYRMIAYEVIAQIDQHHIFYMVGDFSSTQWWSGVFYLLPAVFPFLFSSYRQINFLGILMLLFFLISKVFYLKYMISVWCLFAAIISVYILLVLKKERVSLENSQTV